MRSLRAYLRTLVPVRREERGLALFLYALLTLMVLADWVGKVGADSLFVKRFGIQYIPAMYIVTPIAMLVTSAVLFAIIDRVPRRTLLIGYTAAVLVASVAIQLWIPAGGLVFPVGYVFAHGVKETIYLVFWVYAGNLYDGEQSQRLFPLFAGSILVGKILGGVAAEGLAPLIHTEYFIGAQAVGFLVCLVLLVAYRGLPEGERAASARPQVGARESLRDSFDGYRAVTGDRLLRPFGLGVFFWYFLMQLGSYLYLVGLDASSAQGSARASEDAFSQLYAGVYTSGSIAALVIQTFLTTALVRRLGVTVALFVFPVWYVLSYGGALVAFSFLTAVAIQLGERVVVPAIHRPATELVYAQVPSAIRPRARAFLSGGINAVGNIAAAVALIGAAAAGLGSAAVLAFATTCSVLFVANTWSVRRALGRRIGQNLRAEDPELRRNALQVLPAEGRAVPTHALQEILAEPAQDVADGVRLALTRRGAIAAAADANVE